MPKKKNNNGGPETHKGLKTRADKGLTALVSTPSEFLGRLAREARAAEYHA